MTEERVVYLTADGGAAIVAPNYAAGHTIEDAKNAVPAGRPYRVVPVSDIPNDRSDRPHWTVDISDLSDGVGQ